MIPLVCRSCGRLHVYDPAVVERPEACEFPGCDGTLRSAPEFETGEAGGGSD